MPSDDLEKDTPTADYYQRYGEAGLNLLGESIFISAFCFNKPEA